MKTATPTTIAFITVVLITNAACPFRKSTTTSSDNGAANREIAVNVDPVGTPIAAGAESQDTTAEALVIELYKQHDSNRSPFFQTKNRALVDKYFTKRFGDLIWKDANDSKGEVGAIDADPLYNTQDPDIKNFVVGKASVSGATATVPVSFTNGGRKEAINFDLIQANGSWKIENIQYGGGDNLLKWLKETYPGDSKKETSSTGEFDGKFQVGETTCTVKPVKMAFEVRWVKGKGVETFVFKEGNTFESVTDGDVPNRFEFDDKNYATGTFFRADGKTFPVKRLK